MNNKFFDLLPTLKLDTKTIPEALEMSADGIYRTYYAPFEHVNTSAKIVICGITPGVHQALIALSTAQKALKRGDAPPEALKEAKYAGSFAGAMRKNLAAMLDHIGLNQWLALDSCEELFLDRQKLIHFTSALRNPVLAKGKNYSGGATMLTNEYLWRQVRLGLAEEIQMLPADAIFIPLGDGVDAVFQKLIDLELISSDRVLFGLPHASGANAERIAYFCGKKERENLSKKTNPDKIDIKRAALLKMVGRLNSEETISISTHCNSAQKEQLTQGENSQMKIEYKVSRGKHSGDIHIPHRYTDGSYVVSKTRFEEDQIKVWSLKEIKEFIEKGYAVRMSNAVTKQSPSLVKPSSVTVSES